MIDSSDSTDEPAPSNAPAPAEFEVLAAKLEDKYSAGDGGTTGAGTPGPTSIDPGLGHVITPGTVESFLVMFFDGLAKAHGKHWELSEADKTVLVPVHVALVDEQAPRWFADSQNKALWTWTFVMALFIMTRSTAGARLMEWGMEKMGSLVSKVGGTTKTA